MNIDSIKNYPTGVLVKQKPKYGLENRQKSTSADLCDKKSVNRGYYGGSFTGLNGAAAKNSLGKRISKFASKSFDKMLTLCSEHTVIAQNLVALVLAAGFRPIAIMSLPGKKDKDDKIYASGHSIASGLIGFGFSTVVMYPLGVAAKKTQNAIKNAADSIELLKTAPKEYTEEQIKIMDKLKKKFNISDIKDIENVELMKKFKNAYNVKSLTELDQAKSFKLVTKMLDMAPDVFLFGVAKAMLTVALIPPILKYVFGIEKKAKAPQQAPAQTQNNTVLNTLKPEITKFVGGLK